jgi:hypothetical protein
VTRLAREKRARREEGRGEREEGKGRGLGPRREKGLETRIKEYT